MTLVDEILAIFHRRGSNAYFGESVSMTEHGLQAAHFAERAQAPPSLVVAALLHDVGHLIDHVSSDIADWTEDAHHEQLGSLWLGKRFPPEVSEPVRLHVPAKRYLLATDAQYFAKLSPASVITLKLQGGPMAVNEVAAFEKEDFYRDAVRLRRWDDEGKVAGLQTPDILHYRPLIEQLTLESLARAPD
jgi:phosphonate degradation associated HDIG domain protein